MLAALPMMEALRMTPWPPRPPTRISVLAILDSVGLEGIAEVVAEVFVHGFEPSGALAVHEFAHHDVALEAQAHILGVHAILDDALFLVVLHLVHAIAQ